MEQQTNGSTLLTERGGGTPAPSQQTAPAQTPGTVQTSATTELPSLYIDLDDDLKSLSSISKFTKDGKLDARALAKGYTNAEQLLGREKVPLPKTDEDWERWYAAAGRPEAPEKYEFKRPEKLPDGMTYDEDLEKGFRAWAHGNGLNTRQANGLYEMYVKQTVERQAAWHQGQMKAREDAEAALRREWGRAYDGNIALARGAIQQYADPDFQAYLSQTGLGNDPRMVRAFANIGKAQMGETALVGQPQGTGMTPRDLDTAIADFRGKHWEALSDRSHPEHARLNKEYARLFEQRFAEEAQ